MWIVFENLAWGKSQKGMQAESRSLGDHLGAISREPSLPEFRELELWPDSWVKSGLEERVRLVRRLDAAVGNGSCSPANSPSVLKRIGRQRLSSCSSELFWK